MSLQEKEQSVGAFVVTDNANSENVTKDSTLASSGASNVVRELSLRTDTSEIWLTDSGLNDIFATGKNDFLS